MGTYKTEGRQRLLAFLLDHPDKQFTVEQIDHALKEAGGADRSPVGKSSLYRQLSDLCEDGTVRKYRNDTQTAFVYQFVGDTDCTHHFHLRCLVCGELIHLDCPFSEELLSHIRQDHHFRVDSGRSILYGCCEACAEKQKQASLPTDPEAGMEREREKEKI